MSCDPVTVWISLSCTVKAQKVTLDDCHIPAKIPET
uniref:Uncharacterized protein n=1 Tax=Anguilla anguilla TaxID=7936 RepID=A0A0E9UVF8_ANGAN